MVLGLSNAYIYSRYIDDYISSNDYKHTYIDEIRNIDLKHSFILLKDKKLFGSVELNEL